MQDQELDRIKAVTKGHLWHHPVTGGIAQKEGTIHGVCTVNFLGSEGVMSPDLSVPSCPTYS